jgi:hypothetical protein
MSGMLGAMAISSVSACRHAEGCGSGTACPSRLAVAAGAGFSPADCSGAAAGASAGRGFGNGTAMRCAVPRCLGGADPNRSVHGTGADLRAATAGSACMPNKMATAVTMAFSARPNTPQVHFRLAFPALQFMSIS